MDTKLTLKLDAEVIKRAKIYAKQRKTSLSRMIETFLDGISDTEPEVSEISPLVDRLSGIIKLPEDYDYRKERTDHLYRKHQ